MAVVLIIITFAVFITIDWFINHGKAPALSFAEAHAGSQEPTDDMIAGFHLPKSLRYHPGHTWVQRERKNLNRVGADEFAAIFAGPVDRVAQTGHLGEARAEGYLLLSKRRKDRDGLSRRGRSRRSESGSRDQSRAASPGSVRQWMVDVGLCP